MQNATHLAIRLLTAATIAAAALLSSPAGAQPRFNLPPPETWDCWSWTGEDRDSYCAPKGPYAERCEFRIADSWENPTLLFAFCDGNGLVLPLPCPGAIFLEPDGLQCRPAPKGLRLGKPRPPSKEPIPGCTRLRLVKGGLEALCRGRPSFIPLPCAGRVVNDNGRLACVPRRPR